MVTQKIIIASRASKLALWQSCYVKNLLEQAHKGLQCEIIKMTTKGDKILNQPLSEIGGKALFMKELETAINNGQADIAVHSLKDVPYELPKGFTLSAFCKRENPKDAFVSNNFKCLNDLPKGAIVGTSSLRRKAQLLSYRSDLNIHDSRGNIQTRLQKLDHGQYDAIILAVAGLIRLGLQSRIHSFIDFNISLPAVGQGTIVIEQLTNNSNIYPLLNIINDKISEENALAERSFNKVLQGGCHKPIAALCERIQTGELHLTAMVASIDGKKLMRDQLTGHYAADEIGQILAQKMIARGAKDILLS